MFNIINQKITGYDNEEKCELLDEMLMVMGTRTTDLRLMSPAL